ncbi:MAG: hypothetical protein HY827_01525 [Actinobacteria bacterium]|nr:hypothetical protein [Actinomycetota bacterium]
MSAVAYERIDQLLLVLSEARERAESASAEWRGANVPQVAIEEFDQIERELHAMYNRVMDAAYYRGRGKKIAPPEVQLSLDA